MSYEVNTGDAVGSIVGSKAELVSVGGSLDGLRLNAIEQALRGQGTELTNSLGSPAVAAFNGASVGRVAMATTVPSGPAPTRQMSA